MFVLDHFVVDIYLIKCISWIIRKMCEILSNKQRRHQHEVIDIFLMSLLLSLKSCSDVFDFDFEQVNTGRVGSKLSTGLQKLY